MWWSSDWQTVLQIAVELMVMYVPLLRMIAGITVVFFAIWRVLRVLGND
jgi:hypothetical protein